MKSRSLAAFVSIAAPVVLISAALTTRPLPAAEKAPEAAGGAQGATQWKSLYAEKCSACHNLPKPEEKAMTRGEWQRTVNRMLTKYKASDSISPTEAAHIVDYLATFAPKPGGNSADPWGVDRADVWGSVPSATRVLNFEGTAPMSAVNPVGAGTVSKWRVVADSQSPNGGAVQVSSIGAKPGKFALLAAQGTSGRDVDVRVRFKIVSGKSSPAVGVAFGVLDPTHYSVLRYDQAHNDLALILINGDVHTTLQKTILSGEPTPTAPQPGKPAPAPAPSLAIAQNQWHTLRVSVRDGQVRGWIDMNKRLAAQDEGYKGGKVALWSQGDTTASFDDWTIDVYDASPAAKPAS
ncbi:MAG: hypothetical protein ABIY70_26740 [Capsulimonas sp.]|uniref:hypothetical protein n=1 Tax=Capsulimonas sp. TaxID=2494211 RepID=UPI003265F74D